MLFSNGLGALERHLDFASLFEKPFRNVGLGSELEKFIAL